MSDPILIMAITYPLKEPDKFKIEGNIKPERHVDIIADFLRDQAGVGVDNTPPVKADVYNITLRLDLTDDSFQVRSNTGNLGLRDGILLDILQRLT